ncbi:signal peptide peptidase SppA [bacterium]|nr:signal peptide peptidase SppA [bacterium]
MRKHRKEIIFIAIGLAGFILLVIFARLTLVKINRRGHIGLIKVQGMILEDRALIKQLHKMNNQPLVKGIVIHINTPGGTLASAQSISKEIQKIRRQGKPVVVSMAEVCASGGYYISCAADRVFANPASITGSIGVILRYPEAGQLMEKLGLRMEIIKSGKYKDIGDFSRKLNKRERRLLQGMIDDLHQQFVEMILDTRGDRIAQALAAKRRINITDLPPEDVKAQLEKLADGRVFSGRQALGLGLVDQLGNLDDAVNTAAFLAKIKGKPKVLQEKSPAFFKHLLQGSRNHKDGILGFLFGLKFGSWLEPGLEI